MNPESLIAVTIHRNLVGMYERMGRSAKACASARISLEIILKHNTFQDNELANVYSNMGYALVSAYRAAEGNPYLDTAVNLAKSCPEPGCYLDRFLRNRGRAKEQLKQFGDALLDFSEAEYFQEKMHGPQSL